MTRAVLDQAGRACFTIKPRGTGTGLGLVLLRDFTEPSGGRLALSGAPRRAAAVTIWGAGLRQPADRPANLTDAAA